MSEDQPSDDIPVAKRWEPPPGVVAPPPPPYPQQGYSPPPGFVYPAPPGYAIPAYARRGDGRPSAVSVIGILSIICGGLGFFVNLAVGVQVMGFYVMNNSAGGWGGPQQGVVRPPPRNAPPAYVRGLDLHDRQSVVSTFSRMLLHPLTPGRSQQLDALLERCGQDMVPLPAGKYTPNRIRQAVITSGEQQAAAQDQIGQQYFVTAGGKIQLLDDRGDFRPVDGSDTVRVAMLPSGQVGDQESSENSNTVAGVAPANGAAPATPWVGINPTAMRLVVAATLLSFGLAIFLLVSGILALRSSLRAGRLHLIYAVAKIMVVIFAFWGWRWFIADYAATIAGKFPGYTPPEGPLALPLGAWVGLGLLYPVALLVMLLMQPLRGYYRRIR